MRKSAFGRLMLGASARLNYEWALRFPGSPPFIMLTEFPRSGGNWIRDMLGDALQLPVPRFSTLPVTFRSIVHNHDHRLLHGHPSIYVLRDGRDVFLSHFHKTATTMEKTSPAVRRRVKKLHPSLSRLAEGGQRDEVDLEAFYEEWCHRPLGSRVNWGLHVGAWVTACPEKTVFIRYEDMSANPEETLARAAETLSGRPVPEQTVAFAVWRNSFEVQTGRKAGVAEQTNTKRKGIVGAWKEELPSVLKKRFVADFGDVLEKAGYSVSSPIADSNL